MTASSDRILTTHVGSLPRPDALMDLLRARDRGEDYDADELQQAVRAAVDDVVDRQAAIGIDLVTDGEMSKIGYGAYVKERLTGFDGEEAPRLRSADLEDFPVYFKRLYGPEGIDKMTRPLCTGPIAYVGEAALAEDIANLKAATAGVETAGAFLTAASPGTIALWLGDAHHGDEETYVGAIAEAMKTEYDAIHAAGLSIQLDAPDLGMGRHWNYADDDLATFRKSAARRIEALNHAVRDIPRDAVRLHLCWGNYDGPHHHDVELKDMIDIVLSADVGAISFEAANPRHEHEWKVWRDTDIPDDTVLFPGVINSVTHFIEHPELIADRICRFTDIVGRERVVAGTDCGMSSQAGFEKVDPDIGWAKYASMVEGAALASRRLWP